MKNLSTESFLLAKTCDTHQTQQGLINVHVIKVTIKLLQVVESQNVVL